MKKLFVHMGPHKTGSTYIQKRLHENREALENSGIHYPDAYYLFFGHHYLLNALNGEEGAAEVRESFTLTKSDKNNFLISSENFIYLNKKGLIKLKEAFDGFSFKFIYYIRRPSLRLLSRWHEEVKQGGVVSADSYFVNHLFRPMQSNEVNNFRHVDRVVEVFGRDSVKLIDYDTAVAENNMLALLFSVMGKDAVVSDIHEDVNKMVDLSEVEIIRFLNFRASLSGLLKGSNVREMFYSSYEEFSGEVNGLRNKIRNHSHEVVMGDTGFDKAIQKLLTNDYGDMLVNEASVAEGKIKTIPSCNWMMEPDLINEVSSISRSLLGKLKGGEK